MKDRSTLSLDAVTGITEFTDGVLLLETKAGDLEVEGEALRVESLDREGGRICITGRIDALSYLSRKAAKSRGLFRKG